MTSSALTGNTSGLASATSPGLVGITTQTFAGVKTFSGGIQLPTTGGTPATLNWYEEGTYTPVMTGSIVAGTATYSVQTGNFTRIGRMVFVQAQLTWSAHTGSGNMSISLPYTCANLKFSPNIIDYQNLTITGIALIESQPSTATCVLFSSPTTGGSVVTLAFDTAASIYFSLFYMA